MKLGFLPFALVALVALPRLSAWDYAGHRIINELAFDSLPAAFPAWIRTPPSHTERLLFLAGEPDRWKNTAMPALQHYQKPDHELDLEELPAAGIDLATLTPFRYDFLVRFAAGRAAHPEYFHAIDPATNPNHDHQLPGFLPWAITEYYAKLVSAFSYLMTFEENGGGTHDEIMNAEADLVYMMGVMGHYVGDAAQPLHTTISFNGWEGPNPHGYTVRKSFHSWIDGGFIRKTGITAAGIAPRARIARALPTAARADGRDPIFVAVLDFIQQQNALVEHLYQLDKSGQLEGPGPESAEGRTFIEGQLLKGGQLLGDLWVTAWQNRRADAYLMGQLARRKRTP